MKKILLLTVLLAWAPFSDADEQLDLDDYSGKIVMLDFWASWCVPCRRSFPWMNDMQARYEIDGLVIVAVNLDRDRQDAMRFLESYPAEFQVVFDPGAKLAKAHDIQVMPSSIIIGREGEVLTQHTGFKVKRQQEYENIIRQALGKETKE